METKGPRGIQQSQVWAAADELLHAGQRPTIERVRQKLGSGSPNTVSPMLEAWFASLGSRLRGSEISESAGAGRGDDGVPDTLVQAMRQIWDEALAHAGKVAAAQLSAQASQLALQRQEVQRREADFDTRELHIVAAQAALDESAAATAQAIASLQSQLESASAQRIRAEEELSRARSLLDTERQSSQNLQARLDAAIEAFDQRLRESEERHVANERHMLAEVDRSRQQARHLALEREQDAQRWTQREAAIAREQEAWETRLATATQQASGFERAAQHHLSDLSEAKAAVAALKARSVEYEQDIQAERDRHQQTRQMLALSLQKPTPKARRLLRKRGGSA